MREIREKEQKHRLKRTFRSFNWLRLSVRINEEIPLAFLVTLMGFEGGGGRKSVKTIVMRNEKGIRLEIRETEFGMVFGLIRRRGKVYFE